MTNTEDQRTAHQTIRRLVETAEAGFDALAQISQYLQDARKERGLTQNALARLMDAHPSVVSDIERGNKPVTLDRARKIRDALSNGG